MPVATSRLSFPRPHPRREHLFQHIKIGMPLLLKFRRLQTVRRCDCQCADVLLSQLPDVETNIFLCDKDSPISAINDAVILLKTRKARERRCRGATRALHLLRDRRFRAHVATGAVVSRRNLSISAIENRGLRSALDGRRRPRFTRRSIVAGLMFNASAASTRVSASFGASNRIRCSFMPRRYAPRHIRNTERITTLYD
jgi:hypothetical protein